VVELTVFKSLGLAVEDLAAAEYVLARAEAEGARHGGVAVIPIEEIRRARDVLEGTALRTPLVRLDVDTDAELWLKLEVLQPVRCFKIRGAATQSCRLPTTSWRAASSRRAPGTWRRASPMRRGCEAWPRPSWCRSMRPRRRSLRSSATAVA